MPLSHAYAPAAAAIGPAALQAGFGNYQQRQAERGDRYNQMLLGAALQDRQMQGNWALDQAKLLAGQQANANQQAMQWNQSVMGALLDNQQNLANQAIHQQNVQQEFAQRADLAQQQMQMEREQQQWELELSMRPEANKVYQDLMGRRNAIDQALSEGWITDDQHQIAMQAWANEASQFNPKSFQRSNVWPENQQPGMVWDHQANINGSTVTIPVTRDANGDIKPLISNPAALLPQTFKENESQAKIANMERDDQRANEQFRIKQEAEQAKAEAAKAKAAADTAKSQMERFDAEEERMRQAHRAEFDNANSHLPQQPKYTPPTFTHDQVVESLRQREAAVQRAFGGGGTTTNQGGMPSQPQGQPQLESLRTIFGIPATQMPPDKFARFMVQENFNLAQVYITRKYPGGPQQALASGNPDDVMIVQELRRQKDLMLR